MGILDNIRNEARKLDPDDLQSRITHIRNARANFVRVKVQERRVDDAQKKAKGLSKDDVRMLMAALGLTEENLTQDEGEEDNA